MNETISEQKSEQLFKIHETNTPFIIVEQNDKFKIALGKTLACEKVFNSLEAAKRELGKTNWQLVSTIVVTLINNLKK